MYDKENQEPCIIFLKETIMNIFEKEPQKIGLSQLKAQPVISKAEPSIKNKDVKLSDLMRRAG